jgi:peroxiredoxin
MKTAAFFSSAFLLAMASCRTSTPPPTLTLEGTVNQSAGTVYLQTFHNKMFTVIDSATISKGTFSFAFTPSAPALFGLTLDRNERFSPYFLFLCDSGHVRVDMDINNKRELSVQGSAPHDVFSGYRHRIRAERDSFDLAAFLSANPSSIASAYVLYRDFSYRLTREELIRHLSLLSPTLSGTEYVTVLHELIGTLERVAVGQPAPDFALPGVKGDTLRLSQFTGRGYLLLDFWASWCPPCRRENPALAALYGKYHSQGFDIFAVSLDEKRDAWLQAIAQDDLTWTHVSDLAFWDSSPAHLYGVRAIPSNVLIDPQGIIVARNIPTDSIPSFLLSR